MALKERLARFIRKEIEVVPAASLFTLRVVDVHGRDTKIKAFSVNPKLDPKTQAEALAGEIFEMSADVAKSMIGMARFRLFAKVKREEFRSQYPFVVRGGAMHSLTPDGLPPPPGMVTESEPATPTGMVGQVMRHNEAIMRMMIESMGAMTEGLRQENEALRSRVIRAEEVWQAGREKLEDLMDRSMDRHIKETKELAHEARKDRLLTAATDQFMPHIAKTLPALIAKVSGGALGGGAEGGDGAAPSLPGDEKGELREILMGLDDEAADTLQKSLGPDKLQRLMQLLL